jgi:D-alanyl-D-alanine carboxypeptidase
MQQRGANPPCACAVSFSPVAIFRALVLISVALSAAAAAQTPALSARAWLLLDSASGATLAAHEPALRLEPAALAQLMTAYVAFLAIAEKRIALDDGYRFAGRVRRPHGS